MNNRASSWLTIVITAAVGILFIIWHARLDLLSWIVVAMGILLILPGAYNIITSFTKSAPTADGSTSRAVERRGSAVSSTIASDCTVALGIWMLIQPDFFVELLAYLFAVLLIVYGIYQILVVAYFSRPYAMPWFFYIVPAILVATGVVILCTSVHTMNSVVVLLTGILLLLSAINWALENMTLYPVRMRDQTGG